MLLLPYTHKEWERQVTTAQNGAYTPKPPSLDVNAPDLYLPLMAYTTYILVAGFVCGSYGRFTPDILAQTASTGLVIVALEVRARPPPQGWLNPHAVPVIYAPVPPLPPCALYTTQHLSYQMHLCRRCLCVRCTQCPHARHCILCALLLLLTVEA